MKTVKNKTRENNLKKFTKYFTCILQTRTSKISPVFFFYLGGGGRGTGAGGEGGVDELEIVNCLKNNSSRLVNF